MKRKNALEFLFHANFNHLIHPHSRYDELNRKRNIYGDSAWQYFTEQDFLDLQVWHNLAWIDPIWRNRPDQHLYQLVQKGKHFSEQDKHYVLDQHIQILDQVISIHKRLYSEGKIELTCSPYFHPILPLLCDSTVAKISNPRDPVPQPLCLSGGCRRADPPGIEKFNGFWNETIGNVPPPKVPYPIRHYL